MIRAAIQGASGKMGRAVCSCIEGRDDCRVIAGIDIVTAKYSEFEIYPSVFDIPEKPDVVIDFSTPALLDGLLEYCLSTGTAVVICTTGYNEAATEKIKKAANQIPLFFSRNMSLGINLLIKLAETAAEILGGQFDIEIVEKHHNTKIDAPSGTALMIAEAVNHKLDEKLRYVYDRHSVRKKRDKNEIGIHSIRGGTITGEHEIIFAGRDEVITLSHGAYSKEVFAAGAVNAAVFIANKPAGLYDMKDLVENEQE